MQNIGKLTFTCTDRLGETENLESTLISKGNDNDCETDKDNILANNKLLIEKLKDFQNQINTLMTKFVDKEKMAVASKKLSNEHLKKENLRSIENESDEESDNQGDEDCSGLKRQQVGEDESTQKKTCL